MAERIDQETRTDWNREPGIIVVPGSNYANEMQKFEQFPSKYGPNPGNPYHYRPFPKMVYRAEEWRGQIRCMAAEPDPNEFTNPNEYNRAFEAARRFTERCQLVVRDEREYQRAAENGYRESPQEAVEYLQNRVAEQSRAAAERNYADRNMSEPAKAEAKAAVLEHFDETGHQAAEIPEKPKRRGGWPKGKPRKPVV